MEDVARQLQELQADLGVLAVACLEPDRFTFELKALAGGLSGEDRTAALVVLSSLLGAARGEAPWTWGPDAHPYLRRFSSAYGEAARRVDLQVAVGLFARALDVNEDFARTLIDAHERDGKGIDDHRALRGQAPLAAFLNGEAAIASGVMRAQVERVVSLGRMPSETAGDQDWAAWTEAVTALPDRAKDEEAVALLNALPAGEDSGFGLAWALVRFIESAPHWRHVAWVASDEPGDDGHWLALLRDRAERG